MDQGDEIYSDAHYNSPILHLTGHRYKLFTKILPEQFKYIQKNTKQQNFWEVYVT